VTEVPALEEHLRATCEASGVPVHVQDETALRRIVALLGVEAMPVPVEGAA
jgi:hypothetical protein